MKLTIVLTVYNKGPYLHRVFNSVLKQQDVLEGDFEVLVVNDGSTDDSSRIINEYAQQFSQIRVLTQQNQGLSMARNNGVKEAKGEYVWFVDADDIISANAVHLICKTITFHPDIIPIYAKTQGYERIRNKIPKDVKSGKDILLSDKWEVCGVFNIFKKKFLLDNDLFFYPGIYHEDTEFTPRVLYKAETAIAIPEVLYFVYKTEGSITEVPKIKRAYDCLFVAESNYKIIEDNNEEGSIVGRALCSRVSKTITSSLNIMKQIDKKEWRNYNMELWRHRHLFNSMEQSKVVRYWVLAKLFKLVPKKYVQLYVFLK